MPSVEDTVGRVVRVNDGNDSFNDRELVEESTKSFEHAFFNTSVPTKLGDYTRPVVLTVNPSEMTDSNFFRVEPTKNLMFVRVRTNAWNTNVVDSAVYYYTTKGVPVVLTFMAYYFEKVPNGHEKSYEFRKRTLNSYWCVTPSAHEEIVSRYSSNVLVYACGGTSLNYSCKRCGHCLREYFATLERMRPL